MRRKLLAFAGLLSLFGVLLAPMAVHASNNARGGEVVEVAQTETINTTAYLAGTNITVAGRIQGDLYCAGQSIIISGIVEGDVFCAGQTVSISGNVMGSVHAAGMTITLSGPVGRSLSAFAQNVSLMDSSSVNSDATIFASSIQLGGKIGRDITMGGQSINVSGTIGRNVTAEVGQLTLASGSRIGGNLDYTSNALATVNSGAKVAGTTQRHEPPLNEKQAAAMQPTNLWIATFWGVFYWFCSILVLGLVLAGLAPRSFQTTGTIMIKQGGWALLAGLAALIMTPVVAVMLMITFVGVPLAVVMMLLWVVGLFVSFAYSGYSLGAWLVERTMWKPRWPRALALLIGLVMLSVLMLIPVIGGIFGFLTLIWGLGGVVLMLNEYFKKRKDGLVVAKKAKA